MKVNLNFKIKRLDGSEFIDVEADGVDENGKPKYKETNKSLKHRKRLNVDGWQ